MTRCLHIPIIGLALLSTAIAEVPLHQRIDTAIEAAAGGPIAPVVDDATFLRRVTLDLAGTIPTPQELQAFLGDDSKDKRVRMIDQLLAAPTYAKRMGNLFNVMLMERRGDHAGWMTYLENAFARNKPWDAMAREILHPDARSPDARAAGFFYTKRLEKVGEQPVDHPGLTRDVGRLFLGMDLQCAQCHHHLTVNDYTQRDFQGLFAFYKDIKLFDAKNPAVEESVMTEKIEFASVFKQTPKQVGPRLPIGPEMDIKVFEKGQEIKLKADKKKGLPNVPAFSPLDELAKHLTQPDYKPFSTNMTNRLWAAMMGQGLVEPLDLHHSGNPATHPALLEDLSEDFTQHHFDIRYFIRELMLSRTYQRSTTLATDSASIPEDRYRVAIERGLSAEQMLAAMLTATGEDQRHLPGSASWVELKKRFVAAMANVAQEPEDKFNPSLKGALFLMNDEKVLDLFKPREGNLVARLTAMTDDQKIAVALYQSILVRMPTDDERAEVASFLREQGDHRSRAIQHLAWALATSNAFCLNH